MKTQQNSAQPKKKKKTQQNKGIQVSNKTTILKSQVHNRPSCVSGYYSSRCICIHLANSMGFLTSFFFALENLSKPL